MDRQFGPNFTVNVEGLNSTLSFSGIVNQSCGGIEKMTDSVYKVVELVGTSTTCWEDAVKAIVEKAAKSLQDIRVAEVKKLDVRIDENKVVLYRAKVELSFKYKDE
ncbi:MAG: dodecin family protein [Promethearchaeota archaeon]